MYRRRTKKLGEWTKEKFKDMHKAYSYFDQFEIIRIIPIHPFGNFDISITNSTIFMLLGTGYFVFLYQTNIENGLLVPGRYQTIVET